MSAWPYDSPRRGAATPTKPFGEFDGCIGGWDIEGEPYTQAQDRSSTGCADACSAGARTTGAASRFASGPDDFKRRSLDGIGDDWPITYDEIKPYYDQLDRLVGIFGIDGRHPNEPDGIFLPPPKPRCYELLIKKAADKLHITCIPIASVDPDPAAERTSGLPLLRPVRPRLRDARELLFDLSAPAASAGHRQAARSSPTRWRAKS